MSNYGWWKTLCITAFASCGLLVGGPLSATTVLPLNLAQMSELAEKAFVVHVDSVEATSTATGNYDLINGTVVEPVFGDVVTSQAISWKQFRVSKNTVIVGMPGYQAGREYLIFLSGKGRGSDYQMPVGLGQGSFDVMRNKASGAVMVRNAFMNSTLTAGLNTGAATRDAVAQSSRGRSLSASEKKDRALQLQQQLRPKAAGNSLSAIKEAAQYFHNQKSLGRSPSTEYKTSTTVRLLH